MTVYSEVTRCLTTRNWLTRSGEISTGTRLVSTNAVGFAWAKNGFTAKRRHGRFSIPILLAGVQVCLMSELPSIVTAEPNFRIRLTESWPLRIDTADIP